MLRDQALRQHRSLDQRDTYKCARIGDKEKNIGVHIRVLRTRVINIVELNIPVKCTCIIIIMIK